MATYIALIHFTDEGVRKIRDTRKRAAAFRDRAKKAGATVRNVYWTLGAYDGALVFEAPDDESATALMLGLSSEGFVQSETMRAFDETEIATILGRITKGRGS